MTDKMDFIRKGGRVLYGFLCSHCQKKTYRRKAYLARSKTNYCSIKCRSAGQVTSVKVSCKNCKKSIFKTFKTFHKSKSKNFFCNGSCSASTTNKVTKAGNKNPNYKHGRSSYRAKALRNFEHKCHNPECLLTPQLENIPVEMLDVDHKDNNRSNNELSNLLILCVWCHTLKTRSVEVVDSSE